MMMIKFANDYYTQWCIDAHFSCLNAHITFIVYSPNRTNCTLMHTVGNTVFETFVSLGPFKIICKAMLQQVMRHYNLK